MNTTLHTDWTKDNMDNYGMKTPETRSFNQFWHRSVAGKKGDADFVYATTSENVRRILEQVASTSEKAPKLDTFKESADFVTRYVDSKASSNKQDITENLKKVCPNWFRHVFYHSSYLNGFLFPRISRSLTTSLPKLTARNLPKRSP